MLEIRLNHLLQLQIDSLLTKLCDGFVSKDMFILTDNLLIALGRPFSVEISLETGDISYVASFEEMGYVSVEGVPMLKEESIASELMRYLIMRMRLIYGVKPYASKHMISTQICKLNERLKYYELRIDDAYIGKANILGFINSNKSIELIVSYLLNTDISVEYTLKDYDLALAKRYVGLMRYEEALEIYSGALNCVNAMSMVATDLCISIGELYYFLDDMEMSVEYYKKCNINYIADKQSYYIRLGHSLTDNSMKESGELIKFYYRGILNPNFARTRDEEYLSVKAQLSKNYLEYEKMCEKVGRDYLL